jgi:hypothetical protein
MKWVVADIRLRRHNEVANFVYQKSTFLFHHPLAILSFDAQSPSKLRTITSLQFDTRLMPRDEHLGESLWDFAAVLRHPAYEYLAYSSPRTTSHGTITVPTLWSAVCATIAKMQNLRYIRVSISDRWFTERELIEPLAMAAKALGEGVRWEVEVGWADFMGEDWTGGAFVVERRVEGSYGR